MRQPSELTSRQAQIHPGGAMSSLLRYDLPASLVVFLVALPLSLGIAVASGAPALAGLIAAIVGGVVAGALGGSPLQVSGPAAGLTVIVAGLIAEFGWAITCAITVCAGLLQIVFGLTRVGRRHWRYLPWWCTRCWPASVSPSRFNRFTFCSAGNPTVAWHNLIHLPIHLADANPASMALGLLVIVIMVGWRWAPGAARLVPGPLIAIVAATVVSLAMALNVPRVALNGSLVDALQLPSLPDGAWGAFAAGVLTVALIASVESLLTAVAVDRMQSRTRSNLDRELVGQGAANMVSGAIGGLPITGVIVRSSANVAAGARTRASSILHGIWVLVFALPFAGLVEQIPTAALAGLLVVIGVQLVKLTHIATARRNGDIAVYLVTIIGVVFLNLLEGVVIGLALSILMTTWRVSKAKITTEATDDGEWHVRVQGSCTCLSLPGLHQALSSVPAGSTVTLVMATPFVDHAAQEYIDAWRRQHEAAGGRVDMVNSGAVDAGKADSGTGGARESGTTAMSPRPTRIGSRATTRTERLVISCRDRGTRPAESAGSTFGDVSQVSPAVASSTRQHRSANDQPTPWYVHAEPA